MAARSCRVDDSRFGGHSAYRRGNGRKFVRGCGTRFGGVARPRVDRGHATTRHGQGISGRCPRGTSGEIDGFYAVVGETGRKITEGTSTAQTSAIHIGHAGAE